MKHALKMTLREWYARLLYHTGLHALVSALAPKRFVILAGHCVAPENGAAWPGGEHLPADMKISQGRMRRLLEWFGRRYRVVTVGAGARSLSSGRLAENLVAFSFDDGYRDNHDVLLPLLRETGTTATVFLESRPLDERKVNWSHKLFWLASRMSIADLVHGYGEHTGADPSFHQANQVVTEGRVADPLYQVKRILKYDADPTLRDRAIDALFGQAGGDEGELCAQLYLSWDQARELRDAGVELGGHTASHPILSRLDAASQREEVERGAEALRRELSVEVPTFAYPWGRRWDFDHESRAAVEAAGFRAAVTMHAGANLPGTDRLALHRVAIDDRARMHLLVAEACGGFELLRRIGIDLSE